MKAASLVGISVFGVAGIGCSLLVDSKRNQCETDDDCSRFGDAVCVQNLCKARSNAPSCGRNADCAVGQVCINSSCVNQGGPCEDAVDCESGQECVNKRCQGSIAVCQRDSDCDEDYSCVDEVCEPPPPCDTSDECEADFSCVDGFCKSRWGCYQRGFPNPPPGPANVTILVNNISSQVTGGAAPLPDVTVKMCNNYDTECQSPIQTQVTGSDGKVTVTVPNTPFNGFLEIIEPGFVPLIYHMPTRVYDGTELWNATMVPSALLCTLGTTVGIEAEDCSFDETDGGLLRPVTGFLPMRGQVLIAAQDCRGGVGGIRFVAAGLDAETIPFYAANSIPNIMLTETPDEGGSGGFVNLSASRSSSISVQSAETGEIIETRTVIVREGFISQARMEPPRRPAGDAGAAE